MLPWSVMPSAGWRSAAAAAMSSSSRDAPSSIEYSVWVWRWTKESATAPPVDRLDEVWSTLGTKHTCVIRTLAGRGARCASIVCQCVRGRRRGPARGLEVCAWAGPGVGRFGGVAVRVRARRQRAPHGLQLLVGGHLLSQQHGLHALDKALEPAHQLSLGDLKLDRGGGPRAGRRARRAGPAPRAGPATGPSRPPAPTSRRYRAAAAGWPRRGRSSGPRPAAA